MRHTLCPICQDGTIEQENPNIYTCYTCGGMFDNIGNGISNGKTSRGDEIEYLNRNIDKVKYFESDGFYLRIYFSDDSFIRVEPEYGGIYLFKFNKK